MKTTWNDPNRNLAVALAAGEKRHGIVSLTTGENQPDMVRDPYFLMNIYRVLGEGKLLTIARDEPFAAHRKENGLTLNWKSSASLPAEMEADYTVGEDASVTLRFRLQAARDLADFEVTVGSYFDFSYEPYAVLAIDPLGGIRNAAPLLWKAQDQDFLRGHYIHLPRDDRSSVIRMDGRWNDANGQTIAPAVYGPRYGLPVAIMASSEQGIYVVQSTSRERCDGISITYSSDNEKDSIRNHNATYFSLFGENLKNGEQREAVIKQVIVQGTPDLETITNLSE